MDDPAKYAGGKLGEYAYTRPANLDTTDSERSAADVLKDIVSNIQEIIRSEVRLARAEVRQEAGKAVDAGKMLAIGGVIVLYAFGFILWAVAYALTSMVSPAAAALIVGVVLGIIGGALVMVGRGRMKHVSPAPDKTINTVKENIEWMKGQTRS